MNALLEISSEDTASTVRERVSAWIEEHVPPDWLAAARSGDPRKLREMTGNAVFNEVFLDGVALPDTARLGPVGEGWAVARTTLMNERAALGFLRSRANTIEGGTSEIQRNILGERVLGLRAEPAVDRDIAWQDILSRRA